MATKKRVTKQTSPRKMQFKDAVSNIDLDKIDSDSVAQTLGEMTREQWKAAFSVLDKNNLFEAFEAARQTLDSKRADYNVQQMRERSGNITDNRPMVTFLYLLMRDVATPGQIERCLLLTSDRNADGTVERTNFTNGWLARYAQDVTSRLAEASLTLPDA